MAGAFVGWTVDTSQQHARVIALTGASSRLGLDSFAGQQQELRTVRSMLHRYSVRANAADGSITASISNERITRRTQVVPYANAGAFRNLDNVTVQVTCISARIAPARPECNRIDHAKKLQGSGQHDSTRRHRCAVLGMAAVAVSGHHRAHHLANRAVHDHAGAQWKHASGSPCPINSLQG